MTDAPTNIIDAYPLTSLQKGMLVEGLRNPEHGLYHSQVEFRCCSSFDALHWQTAWQELAAQRPFLRTAFVWEETSEPTQVILAQVDSSVSFTFQDWTDQTPNNQAQNWLTLRSTDARQPFNLKKPPLSRLHVRKIDAENARVLWSYNHMLLDGWSALLVLQDLCELLADQRAALKTRPSYKNYVAAVVTRQREQLGEFWHGELDSATPQRLQVVSPRQSATPEQTQGLNHSKVILAPDVDLHDKLVHTCEQYQLTVSELVHTAWAIVLSRLTGDADVMFGMAVSGRVAPVQDIADIVGLCVNTLPFRLKVNQNDAVRTLLDLVGQKQRKCLGDQLVSLADLSKVGGFDAANTSLESIVVSHDFREAKSVECAGVEFTELDFSEYSEFPITLMWSNQGATSLELIFKTNHIREPAAQALLASVRCVLQQLCSVQADQPVRGIRLTVPEQQLPQPPQHASHNLPKLEAVFAPLFKTNENPALVYGERSLTYAELHQKTAEFARALQDKGGSRIGVLLDDPIDYVVTILASVRLGACYVPLNPGWPQSRVQNIVEQADLDVLVTEKSNPYAGSLKNLRILAPSEIAVDAGRHPDIPTLARHGNELAYIIFTSGSTGTPKGVGVSYANLAYSTHCRVNYYTPSAQVFLLLSDFTFDSSVAGIFGTLCSGGCLVLTDANIRRDPDLLVETIDSQQITDTLLVPSLYRTLLRTVGQQSGMQKLRRVILAGEAVSNDVIKAHADLLPTTKLYNEYGPTEATVWCSVTELSNRDLAHAQIPIGHAIAGTRLTCIDAEGHTLPAGFIGELQVQGPGVTAGYLKPDPAQQNFVAPGVYNTGDRVIENQSGEFIYIGRVDRQLKLRGQRLDPAEMEHILNHRLGESAAIIALRDDHKGQAQLTAFCATNKLTSIEQVREVLADYFPTSLLPQRLVLLDELPLNRNGKVDIDALPQLPTAVGESQRRLPSAGIESDIAQIWQRILELDTVYAEDDFFERGGDSINVLELTVSLRRSGYQVQPDQVFQNSRLFDLAAELAATDESDHQSEKGHLDEQPKHFLPAEHWFAGHNFDHPDHWNMPVLVKLKDDIDLPRFRQAVDAVFAGYAQLNYKYLLNVQQKEPSAGAVPGQQKRGCTLTPYANGGEVREITEALQSCLSLSEGRLVACTVMHGESGNFFGAAFHHLAVDGVSLRRLFNEIHEYYLRPGTQPPASDSGYVSASAWANYLYGKVDSDNFSASQSKWEQTLADSDNGWIPPFSNNLESDTAVMSISLDTHQELQDLAKTLDASLEEVLIASVAQAIQKVFGASSTTIDLEQHGRQNPWGLDLSETIGWLTLRCPLRVPNVAGLSLQQASLYVNELKAGLPDGGLSYQPLLYAGRLTSSYQPIVCFNYFGRIQTDLGFGQWIDIRELLRCARHQQNKRTHVLEINVYQMQDSLMIDWTYPAELEKLLVTLTRTHAECLRNLSQDEASIGDAQKADNSELLDSLE